MKLKQDKSFPLEINIANIALAHQGFNQPLFFSLLVQIAKSNDPHGDMDIQL